MKILWVLFLLFISISDGSLHAKYDGDSSGPSSWKQKSYFNTNSTLGFKSELKLHEHCSSNLDCAKTRELNFALELLGLEYFVRTDRPAKITLVDCSQPRAPPQQA